MTRRLINILFLLILLAACASSPGGKTSTPSPTESPPLATDTIVPTPTPTKLGSRTPVPKASATPRPLPTDTITATLDLSAIPYLSPTPEPIPDSAIQIQSPGPMSKILSPIHLRGYVLPGYQNHARIELLGEDGRMIYRQLVNVYTSQRWAYLSIDIPFEINGAAEVTRLQVSTEDEFGRTNALSSVRLLLVSAGYDEINPPGNLSERCILNSPLVDEQVAGGTLVLDGQYRPMNDQPLIIELTTETGQVIATRLVSLLSAAEDGYLPFVVEIPYSVQEALPVRLSLRQMDDRIGGTAYLYSQVITLNP